MKTRLRVLRAEREWSQAELAKCVGVARATIVSIETRKYDPGLALAFKIAHVFGKTIEEVFLYEPQDHGPARPQAALKDLGTST
jgi:putative transcriptional regulator